MLCLVPGHWLFRQYSNKLHSEKIKTGIISTSSVTHATPACFYGNQINRYGANEELAKQLENARYYNRDNHIYELLLEEIENRKIEGITDVVEKTTEKVGNKIDGEYIAEEIYSFLPDKSAPVSQERKRAYYGGTKKGGRRTRKNRK